MRLTAARRSSPATMGVRVETLYEVECWRKGKLVWIEKTHNLVCLGGLNLLMTATIKSGQAAPTWYVGLIDNATFTAFNFNDTMASHPGWDESIAYSEGTRQLYVPGTVANGYVDNAGSRAQFTVASTSWTCKGAFLTSNNAKGGASGTLYGEAAFATPRLLNISDVLIIKLACQVTSS